MNGKPRAKRGNKFAAHLVLSAKKDKAEFEFPPRWGIARKRNRLAQLRH
jgi:hypothetical protein